MSSSRMRNDANVLDSGSSSIRNSKCKYGHVDYRPIVIRFLQRGEDIEEQPDFEEGCEDIILMASLIEEQYK